METYFGDIGGNLLYKYHNGVNEVHYIQDPSFLLRYGGIVESRCIWDGCCCEIHENNDPYCWRCWDSKENHKEQTNLDELRKTRHKMMISRVAFEDLIHPWIDEYSIHFEPCLTDLSYGWINYTVLIYGDYSMPCGPNGHLLGQYILCQQIQYFFENTDREECIIFSYEYP